MMDKGPLAGFPVLDVEIDFMTVVSTRWIHQQSHLNCSRGAYRQVMSKARPQIIEPIMKVDVFYAGRSCW